ncbi:MAG TPA: hypothetical protein ACFYD6_12940 [Candidatus Brocadiia bacterium]|nr:hypothetical protein [Candidatus Brocadiales bacterium]
MWVLSRWGKSEDTMNKEKMRQKKDGLLSMLSEVWTKTSDTSEEKIEKEVNEAVRAVRKGHA